MDLPKTQTCTSNIPLPFPSSLGPCEERIQFAQALEAGRQEKIQEFPMRIHIRRHGADYQKSHGFLNVFGAWNNSLPTALPTRLMQMNNAKQPISGRTAHCPPPWSRHHIIHAPDHIPRRGLAWRACLPFLRMNE